MDPPTATLMNETTSYNLSEIWPVPMNGGGPFAPNSTRFTESALIREGSGNDAVYTGSARKRREKIVEDAAMGSGNDAVYTGSARKRREKIVEDAAMSDSDGKRIKSSGSGDENQTQKGDGEVNSGKGTEKRSKAPLDAQKDYIHVRARRGQATDSHSLAERARREKISERMRILQDLVPGCNKVIGKALVLDEIINYIQSLQRQVEFLSMKLEAVNTRVSPGIEGFPSKDFGQQPFDTSGVGYCSQPAREYGHDPSPDWLHMHIGGGGFERQT